MTYDDYTGEQQKICPECRKLKWHKRRSLICDDCARDCINAIPQNYRDAITESLDRQDRFFRENPRDESITRKPGFSEQWELMLRDEEKL